MEHGDRGTTREEEGTNITFWLNPETSGTSLRLDLLHGHRTWPCIQNTVWKKIKKNKNNKQGPATVLDAMACDVSISELYI